uniref:BHLH domain-containing protein n=1 Tax=Kalanchoe fedtschenkoi TaxID=63787 RepID=A0A7N0UG79_KALFE
MEFQITCGSGFGGGFDQFLLQGYCDQSSKALVLDCERGELVKAAGVLGKKGVSPAKSAEALKNHSDAERRRRERINAHLATLRGLVPSTSDKMDKAAILAEVITQVRRLKKKAAEAAAGLLIPLDADEVRVQAVEDQAGEGTTLCFKASICCGYRPDLLPDLKLALSTLQVSTQQMEMSTLGGRVKNEFVFSALRDGKLAKADEEKAIAASIHGALSSVLDKAPPLQPYSPQTASQNKKRKLS